MNSCQPGLKAGPRLGSGRGKSGFLFPCPGAQPVQLAGAHHRTLAGLRVGIAQPHPGIAYSELDALEPISYSCHLGVKDRSETRFLDRGCSLL